MPVILYRGPSQGKKTQNRNKIYNFRKEETNCLIHRDCDFYIENLKAYTAQKNY